MEALKKVQKTMETQQNSNNRKERDNKSWDEWARWLEERQAAIDNAKTTEEKRRIASLYKRTYVRNM